MEEEASISISKELYTNLKQVASESGFDSVNEYVSFILEEIVAKENEGKKKMGEDDQKLVDNQLKKMGYL